MRWKKDSTHTPAFFSAVCWNQREVEEVRRKATIIKERKQKPAKVSWIKIHRGIWNFQILPLQEDGEFWWDIIKWGEITVSESAITSKLSDDLNCVLTDPLQSPAFPCYSQNVERGVKLVTEATVKVGRWREQTRRDSVSSRIQKQSLSIKKLYK